MAKKKLNSIVWPNIPNDVYYLDADKVEYDDTETYSEGSVGDALQNKANIDGSYENLTAGNAEQLVTDIRANDQTPYLFRTAGGSVDIGDREYINGIVGGTVAFNQLAQIKDTSATGERNGVTLTDNRDGSFTLDGTATGDGNRDVIKNIYLYNGHKYLISVEDDVCLTDAQTYSTKKGNRMIAANSSASRTFNFYVPTGSTYSNSVVHPCIFDLTLMFGSTIADYIYSLEQATAGAGVAFFKTLFPKPYYAYNAGELKSVKGLVSHDMVGFNQVGEAFELNKWWRNDGVYGDGSFAYTASPQKIRIIPNTTYCFAMPNISLAQGFLYYKEFDVNGELIRDSAITNAIKLDTKYTTFTTSADAYYIGVFLYRSTAWTSAEIADICINLSWDGSRNGEYEPYQKWSYPLDSDLELRGVPKIENGNLYYDGDVYESDGTVTRKYGVAELSELAWIPQAYNGVNYFFAKADSTYTKNSQARVFGYCTLYPVVSISGGGLPTNDKTIAFDNLYYGAGYTIVVRDDSISTVNALKTALTGKGGIIYALATPTTESADPYTSPQIVNDFGTEEFVIDSTIDVPIPVGHNTDYPINLKAQVEMMPHSPDGDGDYIVRQTNGTNEYVSIAGNATIQNILTRLEALEGENNG